jgi:predicted O-methyltransferase YrrM
VLTKLKHALFGRHATQPDPATIDAVRQILERAAAEEDAALPHTELTANHIRSLRVAIDRAALMDWMPKHALAAEIGVAAGDFSAEILAHAEPQTLHLIDSWAHDERFLDLRETVAARFAAEVAGGQVVIDQGYSLDVLAGFPDGYFDWVYLDTGHDFTTTYQELELCRTKVKPGGIIAGHDYVTGHWLGWYRYGVIEAVNTFCVQYNWEMIYLTHEAHRHLSYALRHLPPENT